MTRIALTKMEHQGVPFIAYCGLDENRELTEFHLYPQEKQSILDQIYIGRVENIVPNIHAAFVKISPEQICFLSLVDMEEPIYTQKRSKKKELCVGDEFLVQITREAIKTKDPVCSTRLTLHGKHCMITSHNTAFGVSKKITGDRGKELHALLKDTVSQWREKDVELGMVLRTSAQNIDNDILVADMKETIAVYQKLLSESVCKSVYTVVHRNPSGYVKELKSANISKIDRIYTDLPEVYEELKQAFHNSEAGEKLATYEDQQVSLSTLYHLSGQIEKLLQAKVWMKSGANIIIEQLETLTVIDINTSKNISKKADVIKAVNLEAAREVARQVKLRNISGMIIVDFINMKAKEDENEVIERLKQELRLDPVPCRFIDITKLGLVEITRKKVERSLKEIIGK